LHIESLKDLFHVDALAQEDSIVTLLYLRSHKIAECARRILEVTDH
jgi:hypothetical protein